MPNDPIDETYWRAYLEAHGLSLDELDATLLASARTLAEAERSIEILLAEVKRRDPERAAQLRAELAESRQAFEHQIEKRAKELREKPIARTPDKPM
jgi:hypothetical protein